MARTVYRVFVAILGTEEFAGHWRLELDWEPNADDPLVSALLERHQQTQQAETVLAGGSFIYGPLL